MLESYIFSPMHFEKFGTTQRLMYATKTEGEQQKFNNPIDSVKPEKPISIQDRSPKVSEEKISDSKIVDSVKPELSDVRLNEPKEEHFTLPNITKREPN